MGVPLEASANTCASRSYHSKTTRSLADNNVPYFSDFPEAQNQLCPHRALTDFLQMLGAEDAGTIARRLLAQFGTLGAIFSSSLLRLSRIVDRDVADAVAATRKMLHAVLFEQIETRPLFDGAALANFAKFLIGSLPREELIVVYVNANRQLLSVEHVGHGSVSDVEVNVNSILHRGLDVGASGFFLIHNHPSGDPAPSQADLLVTQRLGWLARELKMPLIEHLIVSQGGVSSVLGH